LTILPSDFGVPPGLQSHNTVATQQKSSVRQTAWVLLLTPAAAPSQCQQGSVSNREADLHAVRGVRGMRATDPCIPVSRQG
jgi:hypothetical protein